jgi:hypothetical protein
LNIKGLFFSLAFVKETKGKSGKEIERMFHSGDTDALLNSTERDSSL